MPRLRAPRVGWSRRLARARQVTGEADLGQGDDGLAQDVQPARRRVARVAGAIRRLAFVIIQHIPKALKTLATFTTLTSTVEIGRIIHLGENTAHQCKCNQEIPYSEDCWYDGEKYVNSINPERIEAPVVIEKLKLLNCFLIKCYFKLSFLRLFSNSFFLFFIAM
mgnify:CR=1 FL=1